MMEYKFDLVIKGTIRAYSPEHAEDRIKELTKEVFNYDGIYSSQEVIKIGDKISPLQTNLYITSDIRGLIKANFNTLVHDILYGLEEFTKKPPIFDRSNYIDVRERILDKVAKYKSGDRWSTPEGEKMIERMTDGLVDEIYSHVVNQIARDIIGGIEEVKKE